MIYSAFPFTAPRRGPARRPAPQSAGGEYVTTYAGDCVTPQTVFNLGDTVCVEAGGFPLDLLNDFHYRRFQWVAPGREVADLTTIKVDPQNDRFVIPTAGDLAQLGTWSVYTVDASAEGYAVAKFIVRDPRLPSADLLMSKSGPLDAFAGDKLIFDVGVSNPGPDFADAVQFIDEVPSNMVFVALRQVEGPPFECATPAPGDLGRIICKAKGLATGEKAYFKVYYEVDPLAREGTVCTGASQVSSTTNELNKSDNTLQTEVQILTPNRQ